MGPSAHYPNPNGRNLVVANYQHIFFDLDRTLWDFDTNSHQALLEIMAEHKLSERGVEDASQFIDLYRDINEHYWGLYREQKIDKATLRWIRFGDTLARFGIQDKELALKLAEMYIQISPLKTGLMPGAKEALDYLASKYRLHIITNGFEEVQHLKLKQSGLEPYFEVVITSEQAGFKKPSPEIFNHACAMSGANATQSIMIGDDLQTDILGAQNSGMDHVFYNPKETVHQSRVLHEIKQLNELRSLF